MLRRSKPAEKPVIYTAGIEHRAPGEVPAEYLSAGHRQRFEHVVIAVEDPWPNLQGALAGYEREGWELVSLVFREVSHETTRLGAVWTYKGYYLLAFKRPVEDLAG